jgi:hypothetical protein
MEISEMLVFNSTLTQLIAWEDFGTVWWCLGFLSEHASSYLVTRFWMVLMWGIWTLETFLWILWHILAVFTSRSICVKQSVLHCKLICFWHKAGIVTTATKLLKLLSYKTILKHFRATDLVILATGILSRLQWQAWFKLTFFSDLNGHVNT